MVIAEEFQAGLYDLDGVVYVGAAAVPRAAESIAAAEGIGLRSAYVTNNAARAPHEVATHLRELGLTVDDSDVVTSAQAGARVLVDLVPAGSAVFVVGGPGIDEALTVRGFRPVRSRADEPVAVIQGFGPDVGWRQLADASYLIEGAVPWVATNLDATIPTPGGIAPGNGTLVAAVRTATGREPVVAGKPEPPLMLESMERMGGGAAVVIGDRLDTDILGAVRVGLPSLLVLTGVSRSREVIFADRDRRPTWLAADLRGLLSEHPAVEVGRDLAESRCREARVRCRDGAIQVDQATDPVDALRAAALLAWRRRDAGCPDETRMWTDLCGELDAAISSQG